MSHRPARIGRLPGHGRPVSVGEPANLVLFDPAYRGTVNAETFASRSRNTPYRGLELPGRVHATFLRGVPTLLAGELVEKGELG
jgi:dihydroorotase